MVDKDLLFARLYDARDFFPSGFSNWVDENYVVFVEFSRVADELWGKGVRVNSINMIREVTRFKRVMANQPVVHFTNSVTPYLGRAYVLLHPERVGMFEYVKEALGFKMHVNKLDKP